MSTAAEAWLTIPDRAALLLGGVKWSHGCDALEDASGQTVALAVQLEQVFDGLFDAGPAPHFAYVIGLLRAMKFGSSDPQFARLHRVYQGAVSTVALARNAGVLIGELCRDLPCKHGPSRDAVLKSLHAMQRNGERRKPGLAHEPLLPLAEVLPRIAGRLERFSDAALAHWFRLGRDGVPESTRVEEVLDSLPHRVLKLLSAARKHPRLVGAASLIPVLDATLTLPPRKQSAEALPQGGYADVTTRGDPDRLLPSQFALDPDDFIRRFAERELLYFKREEPHAARKPERIIVLDQGVRTWGSVRLALAGAALSLLKADARRVGDVRICFTSTVQDIDLRRHELDSLVDHFAASDLTPHPTGAFHRTLAEPIDPDIPRDIILLTHPNNLPIPILEAQQHRRPGDRIFALSVKDDGVAQLDELFDDGLRTLRKFKLDLATAEAVRHENAPRITTPRSSGTWTGDVEPIGFPFRPGLVGEPRQFAFSEDGQWLMILCRDGLLHGLALDGSPPEVLPRAFRNGAVLKSVDTMLGVTDGVVVCGRMRKSANSNVGVTINSPIQPIMTASATFEVPTFQNDEELVVAHYDIVHRRLQLICTGANTENVRWNVVRHKHVVSMLSEDLIFKDRMIAVNLDSGTALNVDLSNQDVVDAQSGIMYHVGYDAPPIKLPIMTQVNKALSDQFRPYLHLVGNSLAILGQNSAPANYFLPTSDGNPLLAGMSVGDPVVAGNTLALMATTLKKDQRNLLLFRIPEGHVLGEYRDDPAGRPFALSPDGTMLAKCFGKRSVGVIATANVGSRLASVSWAKLHENINISVINYPLQLRLIIGSHVHTFRFLDLLLSHQVQTIDVKQESYAYNNLSSLAYDNSRFYWKWERSSLFWQVVPDRWGAVHILTAKDGLIASFLIRRDKAAAWIPDGTFWGDAALIGGPAHPDAAARIGQAIRDAGVGQHD